MNEPQFFLAILFVSVVLSFLSSFIYIIKFRNSKIRFLFYYISFVSILLALFVAYFYQLIQFYSDIYGYIYENEYVSDMISRIFMKLYISFFVSHYIPYIISCFCLSKKRSSASGLPTVAGVLSFFGGGLIVSPFLMLIHSFVAKNITGNCETVQSNNLQKEDGREFYKQNCFESYVNTSNADNTETELDAKKHWTKKDFASVGLKLHLVPLDNKTMKHLKRGLDKESKMFMAEATYPFAIMALIKSIIFSIVVAVLLVMLLKGMGDMIVVIGGFLIASFILWRQSVIIAGYIEFADSFIFSLVGFISLVLTIEIKLIFLTMSIAFGGRGDIANQLSKPKIGIPQGIGLDELIAEGEASELYFKMSNVIDRQLEKNETAHYQRQYMAASKEMDAINRTSFYSNSDEQQELKRERLKQEREAQNAIYHLERK